jgi:hypothetical protein
LTDVQILHRGNHGGLDFGVGDMSGAHAIPVASNCFKVGGGHLGSLGPDCSKTSQVTLQTNIIVIYQRQNRVKQLAASAGTSRAVKGTRALCIAIEKPGFAEQSQVATDPRLRLAKHPTQLANGQLATSENGDDTQPGGLTSSAQGKE